MSASGKRRWSAAEKLRIVLEGLAPGVAVADLCRRDGVTPNLFYLWKKQLLGSASKIFDAKSGRPSAVETRTAADVARFKDVIAEITAENLELKKGLSD
jgi:transposase